MMWAMLGDDVGDDVGDMRAMKLKGKKN